MFKAVLGLVIVALVVSACAANPEKFKYSTPEQLCAALHHLPSWNIHTKSRKAALAERGVDCADADQDEIRRLLSQKKTYWDYYDEAVERQAEERANRSKEIKCTTTTTSTGTYSYTTCKEVGSW